MKLQIVKENPRLGLAARGRALNLTGSSETVRKNSSLSSLSVHCPQHSRPGTDKEFGYYLAGLIEGGGGAIIINGQASLSICFHQKHISTVYYIKTRLGFGEVRRGQQKNKKILIVKNRRGLLKVVDLVNGKFRTKKKIESLQKLIDYLRDKKIKYKETRARALKGRPLNLLKIQVLPRGPSGALPKDGSSVLINHWLAGVLDAGGCFQVNRRRRRVLQFKVIQTPEVLNLLRTVWGGSVAKSPQGKTYYYQASGVSVFRAIKYLDRYHVLSKWLEYRQWRRVCLLVQGGLHKTEEGVEKIKRIKKTMEKMRQSEH
uniref:Putative LAGLIDADG protein n=1 Tax=Agelas oroides TaxID=72715 RepID=A0A0U5J6X8_9METZ|nr:putative LAGLIDADG protein [Agelas oroides]